MDEFITIQCSRCGYQFKACGSGTDKKGKPLCNDCYEAENPKLIKLSKSKTITFKIKGLNHE